MSEKLRLPLLFKLLLIFIFFLPLRSVQIPADIFGFEINLARISSILFTIILLLNICIDTKYWITLFQSGKYRNRYVLWLLFYFFLSIAYYYANVAAGQTILFGSEESFFRSWRGRPFAQLLAFVTYGIIPFLLVQRYAREPAWRMRIERTFVVAISVLVLYGLFQIISYQLGFPVTGRNILERGRDLGFVRIFDLPFYRVNSFGGEPRDFGVFLVGAILFYASVRYDNMTRWVKGMLALMVILFFSTQSNSAFLVAGLSLLVVLLDSLYRRRTRIRIKFLKYGMIVALLVFVFIQGGLIGKIGSRTQPVYEEFLIQLKTGSEKPAARLQAVNFILFFYISNLHNVSPLSWFFGSGYSNFVTPIAPLLERHFGTVLESKGVLNPDAFISKLLVEGGIVGVAIYFLVFVRTLRLNSRMLHFLRMHKDKNSYMKALLLRFSFIAFFVGGAIQISYTYFIVMGLIVGWLNSIAAQQSGKKSYE